MSTKWLDRAFQRELLEAAGTKYPEAFDCAGRFDPSDMKVHVNVTYLAQHGLLELKHLWISDLSEMLSLQLTKDGVDFLADDGGLRAILNVVTVKFEEETLRALLASRIEASALPKEEKGRLRTALDQMSKKGFEEVSSRLVKFAADNISDPQVWQKIFDGIGKIAS